MGVHGLGMVFERRCLAIGVQGADNYRKGLAVGAVEQADVSSWPENGRGRSEESLSGPSRALLQILNRLPCLRQFHIPTHCRSDKGGGSLESGQRHGATMPAEDTIARVPR